MLWLLLACHDPLPAPAHTLPGAVPEAWQALGVPLLDGVTEAHDRALTLRSEDRDARWTEVLLSLERAGWKPEAPALEEARVVLARETQRLAVARVGEDVLSLVIVPPKPAPSN